MTGRELTKNAARRLAIIRHAARDGSPLCQTPNPSASRHSSRGFATVTATGANLAQMMDGSGSLASASRYATTSAAVQPSFVPKTPTRRARSSPLVTMGGSDPESRS